MAGYVCAGGVRLRGNFPAPDAYFLVIRVQNQGSEADK
jgi:hypothetical protein